MHPGAVAVQPAIPQAGGSREGGASNRGVADAGVVAVVIVTGPWSVPEGRSCA